MNLLEKDCEATTFSIEQFREVLPVFIILKK